MTESFSLNIKSFVGTKTLPSLTIKPILTPSTIDESPIDLFNNSEFSNIFASNELIKNSFLSTI